MSTILKWKMRGPADAVLVYRSTSPFDRNSLPSPVFAMLPGDATTYQDNQGTAGTRYFYMVVTQAGSPANYRFSSLQSVVAISSNNVIAPPSNVGPTAYCSLGLLSNQSMASGEDTIEWDYAYEQVGGTWWASGADIVVPPGVSTIVCTLNASNSASSGPTGYAMRFKLNGSTMSGTARQNRDHFWLGVTASFVYQVSPEDVINAVIWSGIAHTLDSGRTFIQVWGYA